MLNNTQAPSIDLLVARSLEASLTVRDLSTSVEWYRGVLGFTVAREYRREERLVAVALESGGVELLLVQDDGAKGSDRAKGEGFSLQITTVQDIDELAARGAAVLLISSELPEIVNLCTRIIVLREGRIAGELPRGLATQDALMRLMAGVAA